MRSAEAAYCAEPPSNQAAIDIFKGTWTSAFPPEYGVTAGTLNSFDDVRERAQRQWDTQLGIIKVEGASADELTTLFSSLYRLFLYPNEAYENTGSAAQPHWQYAGPFSAPTGNDTPTHTGARLVDGKGAPRRVGGRGHRRQPVGRGPWGSTHFVPTTWARMEA